MTNRAADLCCRGLVIAILVIIAALWTGVLDRTGALPASAMQAWGGKAFEIPLRFHLWSDFLYRGGDSNERPTASRLRLLEDGRRLGPPHSIHAQIAAQGGGRYSHWQKYLVFSSSDGSDPRVNGRRYTFVILPVAWRWLLPPVLLLAGLVCWRQRRGVAAGLPEIRWCWPFLALLARWRRAICYGASLGVAAYIFLTYLYGAPPIPVITPDSGTYWQGFRFRTIGYPAFLWAVVGAFGSLRAVVLVQLVLFILAVLAVQTAIERLTRSSVVAAASAIALLVLGSPLSFAIGLMTESLFTSLLLLHAAAAGHAFARRSRLAFLGMATTAVLTVVVRPAGYFLFGGILLLLLVWPRERKTVFLWLLCPAILLFATYFIADRMLRATDSGIVAALALFAHISAVYQPPSNLSPTLLAATQGPVLKAYQEARRHAASWEVAQGLEANSCNPIIAEVLVPLGSMAAAKTPLLRLSFYTIERHPFGYGKIILQNLFVWYHDMILAVPPAVSVNLVSDYKYQWATIEDFLSRFDHKATAVSLANIDEDWLLTQPSAPLLAFAVHNDWRRVIKTVCVVASLLAVIAVVLGYASPSELFVAYVAALTAGGALLVSLTSVFIDRYAIPLDSLVLITAFVGAWTVLVRCTTIMRRTRLFASSKAA